MFNVAVLSWTTKEEKDDESLVFADLNVLEIDRTNIIQLDLRLLTRLRLFKLQ